MKKTLSYNLIILLGGKSSRFEGDLNKVYCLINNIPVFVYSLKQFEKFEEISKIIIVYNKSDEKIINYYQKLYPNISFVTGGIERYESVLKGLELCNSDVVIVHDGARPNIEYEVIKKAIDASCDYEAVSVGVKVTDTIKKVTSEGIVTINRDNLFLMQTPQIVKTELLKRCLSLVQKSDGITDDLMAIEKYSRVTPHIVEGNRNNFKITTKEDFELMKLLLEDK